MEKTQRIVRDEFIMEISDLDEDNEMQIQISTGMDESFIWLDEDEIKSLKSHLDYLLSKFK